MSIPIHDLGQPSRPRQYRSSKAGDAGAVRFIVEVFAEVCFRVMELITILNRCYRFRGFVYDQARFTSDDKSIEISVRPRKRSAVQKEAREVRDILERLEDGTLEKLPAVDHLLRSVIEQEMDTVTVAIFSADYRRKKRVQLLDRR